MKPPRSMGLSVTPERVRYNIEQDEKVLSNVSFGTTPSNTDGDMNMQCFKANGTTAVAPNTPQTIQHTLTHVPFGFIVVRTNKAAHIVDSGVAWTAATKSSFGTISIMSDVASVAFQIIIL